MSGKHPEWIEGVLTDMYVNPEYAKILAENALSGAINSEQIVNFLEFTKKSRDARRLEAERKRAAAGPRLATPWSQGMRKMTKEEVAEKYRREKEGAGGP